VSLVRGRGVPRLVVRVFLAPELGYGRAVECGLALGLWLSALQMMLFPAAAEVTRVTGANITGHPWSQGMRIIGLLGGLAVWTWFLYKAIAVGLIAAPGVALIALAIVGSLRQAALAWANLPFPGAPGARVDHP